MPVTISLLTSRNLRTSQSPSETPSRCQTSMLACRNEILAIYQDLLVEFLALIQADIQ